MPGFEILIVLGVPGDPGFDDIVKCVHESEQQFADFAYRVAAGLCARDIITEVTALHVVCQHRARTAAHHQAYPTDFGHRQIVDIVKHTGYLLGLQIMFATQVFDYVLLAADSRLGGGQVFALGKRYRAFVVFTTDDRRVRKHALPAPQTIAQHVRAH